MVQASGGREGGQGWSWTWEGRQAGRGPCTGRGFLAPPRAELRAAWCCSWVSLLGARLIHLGTPGRGRRNRGLLLQGAHSPDPSSRTAPAPPLLAFSWESPSLGIERQGASSLHCFSPGVWRAPCVSLGLALPVPTQGLGSCPAHSPAQPWSQPAGHSQGRHRAAFPCGPHSRPGATPTPYHHQVVLQELCLGTDTQRWELTPGEAARQGGVWGISQGSWGTEALWEGKAPGGRGGGGSVGAPLFAAPGGSGGQRGPWDWTQLKSPGSTTWTTRGAEALRGRPLGSSKP